MRQLFPRDRPVTKDGLNRIPAETLRQIRPGPGIRIMPIGDGGIAIAAQQPRGRGTNAPLETSVYAARYVQSESNGDHILVKPWNYAEDDWSEEAFPCLKPVILQRSTFHGKTLQYADGRNIEYTTAGVDARQERIALWDDEEELQAITSPYYAGEILIVAPLSFGGIYDEDAEVIDTNNAGRHWAMKPEEE